MRRPYFLLFGFLLWISACSETPADPKGTASAASETPAVEISAPRPADFAARIEALCDTLFPDYQTQEMQPVDKTPRFKRANQSIYRRYRRTKPIKVEINPRVYPRLTLKAFRFGDERSVDAAVTERFNQMDSSADTIVLGQNIRALKSPPMFCAILGQQYLILQTSCLYQHPTYDEMRERFFSWVARQDDARYAWEVTCAAGKVEYRLGGMVEE